MSERERFYREAASQVRDIARRIGPAAVPEWVRDKLDRLANQWEFWAGAGQGRPIIVCLCGSTRFRDAYAKAFYDEEHAGRICLGVPCYKDDPCCKTEAEQAKLDALHRHKIVLADEVLVLDAARPWCRRCQDWCESAFDRQCRRCNDDVDLLPYVGESTRREIAYAESLGKKVRYLSREAGP